LSQPHVIAAPSEARAGFATHLARIARSTRFETFERPGPGAAKAAMRAILAP
jgi:hypothetical protein